MEQQLYTENVFNDTNHDINYVQIPSQKQDKEKNDAIRRIVFRLLFCHFFEKKKK